MKIITFSKTLMTVLVFSSAFQINAQQKKQGIDMSFMDKSVSPKDNFFQFVNGTWLKNTEIPADKTRWGSFDELRQNTDKDALAILKDAAKNPKYKSSTDQGKAIPCLFLATVSMADLYMLIALPWSVLDLYLGFLAASFKIAKASLSVF